MPDGFPQQIVYARPSCDVSVEACFPRARSGTSVVLFESPNEKVTATRLAFLRNLVGTRVIMLARSSKHCRFRSRMRWKNGTFTVHSCAVTIDISKFEKNGNVCGLFQGPQLIH